MCLVRLLPSRGRYPGVPGPNPGGPAMQNMANHVFSYLPTTIFEYAVKMPTVDSRNADVFVASNKDSHGENAEHYGSFQG